MQRDVVTCTDRDGADYVAQLMWKHDIGSVVVVNDARAVIGIITDRDLAMAAFTQGRPLSSIAVSTAMAKEVATCHEHDDLLTVQRAMRERQVRRVPIVDDQDRLIGIVTLNDFARAAAARQIPSDTVSATLAAVSHPRAAPISGVPA